MEWLTDQAWHYYAMVIFYTVAGISHFTHASFFKRAIPPVFNTPGFLVMISGVAELILTAGLLFDATQIWALTGIIIMLVLYLYIHIEMLVHPDRLPFLPYWVLVVRLPLQFVLIYWAYAYL